VRYPALVARFCLYEHQQTLGALGHTATVDLPAGIFDAMDHATS
jgi:hypothetical protein